MCVDKVSYKTDLRNNTTSMKALPDVRVYVPKWRGIRNRDSKFGSFGVSDSGYEYFARPQWRLVEVPYGGFVLRAHRRPFDTGIRLTRTPTHDSILFSFLLSLSEPCISSRPWLLFYGTLIWLCYYFFHVDLSHITKLNVFLRLLQSMCSMEPIWSKKMSLDYNRR